MMKPYTYIIRDLHGNKLDEGTSEELAERFFVEPGTIREDALYGITMVGRYTVECREPHTRVSGNAYHYCLYDSGGNRVMRGTASQIAKILNVPNYKVSYSAREHKKLAGKYTIIREVENHAN